MEEGELDPERPQAARELTEDELIEQRRKRRRLILERHQSQARAPELVKSSSATHVAAEAAPPGALAAEYDPSSDQKRDFEKNELQDGSEMSHTRASAHSPGASKVDQDSRRHVGPGATTQPAAAASNGAGELEDDMFASPVSDTGPSSATAGQRGPAVPRRVGGIVDNWDDAEGYYKIVLTELLNERYLVTQVLGKGMFASVVRARDTQAGDSDVAIKIIRNNETMYDAGKKEAAILQELREADPQDRRHIVRLLTTFEHRGHLCLVFENLNANLREIVRKFGRDVGLNIRAVRAYAAQMFMGLALLRKCNIIHADIKPDNMLVSASRTVLKICDLGSASHTSDAGNEVTPYLASRFYRAPEVIIGLPYDGAIDVWAIGCSLYELYTGRILFPGRSNNQMLRLIMETKGRLPAKMIRRGEFGTAHFDADMNFISVEVDKITENEVVKTLPILNATHDIKSKLSGITESGESAQLQKALADLLEQCLELNPDRRITPLEALRHPFLQS